MAINQISTANTFGHLVTAVAAVIAVANNVTDGPNLTSNATITITTPGYGLNVVYNAVIGGNLTLGTNLSASNVSVTGPGAALQVANNAVISKNLTSSNVTISGPGAALQVTNDIAVGGGVSVVGTITLTGTGTTLNVVAGANATRANITTANIATANITTLTGNCTTQFDAAGKAIAMAIALG